MQNTLDISQVAKRSGLPASTLRYYEEKGLIKPIGRNGLRRVYRTSVIETLSSISLGQLAGLSLNEIGKMISTNGQVNIDREQLLTKANQLDKTISRLKAMRDGLKHAAACPEKNHFECPKFNKLLKKATRKTKFVHKK